MILLTILAMAGAGGSASANAPDLPSTDHPPASSAPHPNLPQGETPTLRSFLDPQSEAERRRLIDQQERTFQLEVDAKYARALKAYCDTGFGDERCFRPDLARAAPLPPPALPAGSGNGARPSSSDVPPPPDLTRIAPARHDSAGLPTVARISGFGDDLTAVLVFAGGRRLRVRAPGPDGRRSVLPGGESVVSVRPGEVLISRPGEGGPIPLLFQPEAPSYAAVE